ncbi:DUF2092 domain-containing protein [Kaistia nematophila]|uniref:DUF2092 domain-containing protein n=1 Tax=Kaistia nematophila TaxID=2994654 RepID=A0A9X3ILF6_9HYPH|nr:DUF2092 domain-containing protein [Kaistia nematophila]MCX5568805.1 DUF2092 domain-containing protein [Kaistia nematophila]
MRMHALSPLARAGWRRAGVLVVGVATALAFGEPARAQDASAAAEQNRQDAIEIVKGMARYVGGQTDITLAFDSELEVVTPQMEKLQFNSSGKAQIHRPDEFRVSRTGGYADVELLYDGKSVTVYDKSAKTYASEPMSGSMDSVVDKLRGDLMLDMPAADLMIADSFNALMADVVEAKHIGRGVINGIACEHVAFRNHDTDWQLWVEVGEQPIPCKMVITSKTVGGAPQYTIRFTDWHSGTQFPAGTFAFKPPEGARKVDFSQLADIDEIPAAGAMPNDVKSASGASTTPASGDSK